LASGFRVFASSKPDAIPPGSKWRDVIVNHLRDAEAFVVLITPASLKSSWLAWEAGFFEAKGGTERMYLLSSVAELPPPLQQYQTKAITDAAALNSFFHKLRTDLGVSSPREPAVEMLVDEAKQLGSKPPERSMEHFLNLVDKATWDSFEDNWKRIYVCQEDMLFQMQIDFSDEDTEFDEPWVHNFPDRTARKRSVNMLIAGQLVSQFIFISLDGGRYFVPLPQSRTSVNGSVVDYYWERNSPDFRLFRVVSSLRYAHPTIEELAMHTGVTLVDSLGGDS
jgi:hypothetical protein